MNKKRKSDQDDFEWTKAKVKASKKINSLPKSLQQKLASRKTRGPQTKPTKVSTTIRLSSDVIETFKATGDGWQTRIDFALKQWLKEHTLA
ncbi:BrnA antitoxin family protein [Polynucleobacter necessarius]|uniref:BrnA antitoxin family protein n=1 Tax=Polynucleobacter necessarius TaxID=576610 RepID=UPI000E096008|nr:BrnA antitoxin family protein [Polynucleobacter necessarius]